MILYYYVSAIGIMQMKSLITIEKMALPDSYLQAFQRQFETSLQTMQPISVFILNPGDLRNITRLDSKSKFSVNMILHFLNRNLYTC